MRNLELSFNLLLVQRWILFALLTGIFASSMGANCTSQATGNWNTASTWDCVGGPTCGDNITVMAAHTVTITSNVTYACGTSTTITVESGATLHIDAGRKLSLPSGSVINVEAGAQVTFGNTGAGTNVEVGGVVVASGQSSGGTFSGPGTISGTAPIELVSFSAEQANEGIKIEWYTASETNNSHFEIERSNDSERFSVIYALQGAGNSSSILKYQYIDKNPYTGRAYYRLKQVDFDGTFSHSSIVEVHFSSKDASISYVYPNPVNSQSILKLPTFGNNPLGLTISDLRGKILFRGPVSGPEYKLAQHRFSSGVYMYMLHEVGKVVNSGKFMVP